MPRQKTDYSRTVMYKIVCNDLNVRDLYIGSTTNFIKRKHCHKKDYKNENINFKVYNIIKENGGWENWDMIEIEKYPCIDRNECRSRERYWYELLNPSMNTLCPFRSKDETEERKKQYRTENKENAKIYHEKYKEKFAKQRKEYFVKYQEINKEKIKEKKKEYYQQNKEKIKEIHKKYNEENKEKIKESRKNYYQQNKEKDRA